MMAYMDSGLKSSHPSTTDLYFNRADAKKKRNIRMDDYRKITLIQIDSQKE